MSQFRRADTEEELAASRPPTKFLKAAYHDSSSLSFCLQRVLPNALSLKMPCPCFNVSLVTGDYIIPVTLTVLLCNKMTGHRCQIQYTEFCIHRSTVNCRVLRYTEIYCLPKNILTCCKIHNWW